MWFVLLENQMVITYTKSSSCICREYFNFVNILTKLLCRLQSSMETFDWWNVGCAVVDVQYDVSQGEHVEEKEAARNSKSVGGIWEWKCWV